MKYAIPNLSWAAWRRAWKDARQNAGLCLHCDQPPSQGRRLCPKHLSKDRQRKARPRLARQRAGLCSRCDSPRYNGQKHCLRHLRKSAAECKGRYEARKALAKGEAA
jgi:hypothetical protein